jgi:hypothetical protein
LIIGSSLLTVGHYWGGDFSAYIMQAENIMNGTVQQYIEENTFTIKNTLPGLGPIIYPWGYPILILPAIYFFGLNLWAIKAINFLFFLPFLICVYFLFVDRLSKFKLFVLLFLVAFSPLLLKAHDFILSDIPFLFFSTLSIFLIDFFIVSGRRLFSKKIDYLLIGASVYFAFSIRQNGALLLLVLIICQIIQVFRFNHNKPFKLKSFLPDIVLSFSLFILLGVHEQLFVSDSTHIEYILNSDVFDFRYLVKFFNYLLLLPTFITNFSFDAFENYIIFIILFPFMITGLYLRWKSDYHFMLYSGFSLGLYLLFPSFNSRYIFPILPFYIYFVVIAMFQLGNFLDQHNLSNLKLIGYRLIILAIILEFAFSFTLATRNLRNNREISGPFDPISTEMFQFVSDNTEPESIIAFFKPRVLRFFTGRNSFRTTKCRDLLTVDYLIVHKYQDHYWDYENSLEKCSRMLKFEEIFNNQKFWIYSINKK